MTDHLDPVLLAKWVAGQLAPEERRAVDRWLSADPSRRAALDEVGEIWDQAEDIAKTRATAVDDPAVEMARWHAIQRAIGVEGVARGGEQGTRTIAFPMSPRAGWRRRWLRAAAAAIVVAIGGGTVWQVTRYHVPAAEEFVAVAGPPRTMTLSDGSVVTLAAGSRLTFLEGRRPGSNRQAVLDGQAFFAVAHDAERPFIVTAGAVTTRVLGTEFNVRAYADDDSPTVAVRSGKVGVTLARGETTAEAAVTPGREAWIDSAGQLRIRVVDLDRRLAWTTGRLEFVGAEVRSVLRDVNRWYGLQLQLADRSLADHHVTVSFERATADDVVATLVRLLGPSALISSPLPGSRR